MPSRLLVTATFATLLITAFFVTEGTAQPNSVKKIAEGVWFREGDMKQGHSNNTIIEMKDYLIVIDANFPSGARLAMADAKKLSPKPVKYVFITHHHGDHDYGSAVWTAAGATTFAYKAVVDELNRYEPARWQEAAKTRPDVADLHRDGPEYPKQTFDKSSYILKDSTREVQFLFFGWAHTRGDGFAWLPKERVLCTGDASTNGPYNNTADASIANWPKVLADAEKLKPLHVLPGHGPAGGSEILEGQAAFMVELRKAAEQGRDTVPATVQHWAGASLLTQIADARRELHP